MGNIDTKDMNEAAVQSARSADRFTEESLKNQRTAIRAFEAKSNDLLTEAANFARTLEKIVGGGVEDFNRIVNVQGGRLVGVVNEKLGEIASEVTQLNGKATELVALVDERTRPVANFWRNADEMLVSFRTLYGPLLVAVLLGLLLHYLLTPSIRVPTWQQDHLLKLFEKLQHVREVATNYLLQIADTVDDGVRVRIVRFALASIESGKDVARETVVLLDSWFATSEKRAGRVKFGIFVVHTAIFLALKLLLDYKAIQLEIFSARCSFKQWS